MSRWYEYQWSEQKKIKFMVPLREKRKTCYDKQPFGYTPNRRTWMFFLIYFYITVTVNKWAAMSSIININPSSLCWEVASLHGWYATQSLHKHSQPCPDTLSVRQEPGTVYMCMSRKSLHVLTISVMLPSETWNICSTTAPYFDTMPAPKKNDDKCIFLLLLDHYTSTRSLSCSIWLAFSPHMNVLWAQFIWP